MSKACIRIRLFETNNDTNPIMFLNLNVSLMYLNENKVKNREEFLT